MILPLLRQRMRKKQERFARQEDMSGTMVGTLLHLIFGDSSFGTPTKKKYHRSDWANDIANISVRLIGVADPTVSRGVIISSFNAG